jgi:hypothetical protein
LDFVASGWSIVDPVVATLRQQQLIMIAVATVAGKKVWRDKTTMEGGN